MRTLLFAIFLLLCACGNSAESSKSSPEQVFTKNIDLGTYIGYYEVTIVLDGKEKLMYRLYNSIETPHVYLTYKPWTAREFDPCLLRVDYKGDSPMSNWGRVYFVDPTDPYDAYIIW